MPIVLDSEKFGALLNKLLYSRKLLLFLAVAGVLLTALVAVSLYRLESRAAAEAMLDEMHDRARFLSRELDAGIEALYTLGEVTRYVSPLVPEVFADVANSVLVRNPGVLAFEWLPHVRADQLPQFERAQQSYHPGYRVLDVAADRSRQPVAARPVYFPVAYVVPYNGSTPVLGVDFYGNPKRRTTLEQAWTSGALAASPPLRLLQLETDERGLLLVLPVFRGRPETPQMRRRTLRGFVIAAVDMKQLVTTVFGDIAHSTRYLQIEDITDPTDPQLLYHNAASRPQGLQSVSLAPVGGRVLSISVSPLSGYQSPAYLPLAVALAGGLMVLVVCGYLYLLQRRGEIVSAQVADQTQALRQVNFRLAALSVTDPLTGLSNRRAFDDYLEQEWHRALRERSPLSLVLIDVDHFKRINDNYGHPAGDAVLRELAARLRTHFRRPADRVARFGGEEFAVILPSTASAEQQAERFCSRLAATPVAISADQNIEVTVSAGVAVLVPQSDLTPRDFIKRADEELYRAKREGRNCVRVFRGI